LDEFNVSALRAYRERLEDQKAVAEESGSSEGVKEVEGTEAIIKEVDAAINRSTSRGGLPREKADPYKKQRQRVANGLDRCKAAIKKAVPRLYRHLDASLDYGTVCRYEPESPTIWSA